MSPICDIAVYPVIVAAVILFAICEAFHVIEGGTVFLLSSSIFAKPDLSTPTYDVAECASPKFNPYLSSV